MKEDPKSIVSVIIYSNIRIIRNAKLRKEQFFLQY